MTIKDLFCMRVSLPLTIGILPSFFLPLSRIIYRDFNSEDQGLVGMSGQVDVMMSKRNQKLDKATMRVEIETKKYQNAV